MHTFTLEAPEANLILNALAALPYAQSHGIIAKLQQQAASPPPPVPTDAWEHACRNLLSVEEFARVKAAATG